MNFLARFILWFFATYLFLTAIGWALAQGNAPVGAVLGWGEYALFHILTGNADLRQYEPVALMFIYIVIFIKASIALTISAAITGVQYAQSKR